MQRAEFDARDVAQAHDLARGGFGAQHDVAELLRDRRGARAALTCISKARAGGRGRLADLAGRDLDVLFGQRVLDVHGGDAEIGEPVRIEPDAHRIAALAEDLHVAHAGQALQRIDDLQRGVIAQRDRIDGMVGRGQVDDEDEVRILLLDGHAGLIDDRRQRRGRLRDAILHVHRRDRERIADLEGDGDGRGAVVRTGRRHIGHAGDAVDLLFERRRHRVGHDLRAGAGIDRGDDHLGRRDVGKLRDRQQEIADRARHHHDDGDGGGEDRAKGEEADHRAQPAQAMGEASG